MKTIAVPRTPRSILSSVIVIGGLAALYFYRKNGGSVRQLLSTGWDKVGTARDYLKTTEIPGHQKGGGTFPTNVEIAESSVDMDRYPST